MISEAAVVTVTVTCRDGDGNAARHRVFIHQDGSVSIPDHDNEPWGEDARVLEHLDPSQPSPHACDWWAQSPTKFDPILIGWVEGSIRTRRRILMDPTEWQLTVAPTATSPAARATVFSRYALDGRESDPTIPLENIVGTITFLAERAQEDSRVPLSSTAGACLSLGRFQNFIRSTPTQTMMELIHLGVPWYAIPGLRALGLNNADTANAYQLVAATDEAAHLQWFTGSPRSLELALDLGISRERLVPFLQRRNGLGPIMEARAIHDKISLAVADTPGIDASWIAEAVASLPSQTVLAERYGPDVAAAHCNGNWQHLLVHDVAADTAILMLQTLGDPAEWPEEWEFPSETEIQMALGRSAYTMQSLGEPT